KRLDMTRRLELSQRVGEAYGPQAMRDFGALVTRAEVGDARAAESILNDYFRDTARLSRRASQMATRMDSPFVSSLTDEAAPGVASRQATQAVEQTTLPGFELQRPHTLQQVADNISAIPGALKYTQTSGDIFGFQFRQ